MVDVKNENTKTPSDKTLQQACKICLNEDKPLMLDYWKLSTEGKILIGVKSDKEKLLVKSEDEYTSPITKIYKLDGSYIVLTENSVYIVDEKCPSKGIS